MRFRRRAATRAAIAVVAVAAALAGCRGNVRAIEKSMEPTIHSGDLVTLDEHAYDHSPPRRGDIVVLTAPAGAEREMCGVPRPRLSPCPRPTPALTTRDDLQLIKRIIAGPGQRVALGPDGGAIVDGRAVSEPYAQLCARGDPHCARPRSIRVPPDHWFVLGDNRPYSSDSRYWGPVPTRAIAGRVSPARPVD